MVRVLTVVLSLTAACVAVSGQANVRIADGVDMPTVLLGTGYMPSPGRNGTTTATMNTKQWLSLGARGIDTAYMYEDQSGISAGIDASGVSRDEIFVLTKIPGTNGYSATANYIAGDLKQLGMKQLDLVLIHWCGDSKHLPGTCTSNSIVNTWKALEDAVTNGTVKAIGISNFCENDLKTLLASAKVKPALHQFERHPGFTQDAVMAATTAAGIHIQGYAPLGDPDRCGAGKELLTDSTVTKIASAHSISPGQVLLKWALQTGTSVSPRVESGSVEHMKENIAVMGDSFATLTDAEMKSLSTLKASGKCWPVGIC